MPKDIKRTRIIQHAFTTQCAYATQHQIYTGPGTMAVVTACYVTESQAHTL